MDNIQALLTEIARQKGIGFGQLASARANIGAIIRCGALLLFGHAYGVGASIGFPGLPFVISGALIALAHLIFMSTSSDIWDKITENTS
eukprot:159718-Prorocentrum_lima.AAC.1